MYKPPTVGRTACMSAVTRSHPIVTHSYQRQCATVVSSVAEAKQLPLVRITAPLTPSSSRRVYSGN